MSRLGHRITRRQTLGLAGLAGAAYVIGPGRGGDPAAPSGAAQTQTPSCVLVPEVTEGPYFIDQRLKRADIRANSSGGEPRNGIPLTLTINVVEVGTDGGCTPYAGAAIDIWHCDAEGVYSGVQSGQNPGGTDTDFLRGYQVTNAKGAVTFRTIFPGWYRGRAIHIHLKVRTFDGAAETYEYTSQLFFSETTITQAYATQPYSGNGSPDTSNASDGIYGQTGGTSLVSMSGNPASGLTGKVTLGLSGLPANQGGSDASADARLLGLGWTRSRGGARTLRARVDLGERMRNVQARLVRDGRMLASRKVTGLRKGTRTIRIPVGSSPAAGPATLEIRFRDARANVKTVRRRLRIPQGL